MKNSIVPIKNAKKIIVRLPNFLGDSIMSTPALQLLLTEYPTAMLTIVCKEPISELFQDFTRVEEIIIDDTKKKGNRILNVIKLIGKIRSEKYDLGVLFHNSFLNALIFRLARISHVIGYKNESRGVLLTYGLKMERRRHYVNHYAELVNSYLNDKYKILPELNISIPEGNFIGDFDEKRPIVGLSLGFDEQKGRSYPKSNSISLIHELLKLNKYNLVILGGKSEVSRGSEYINQISASDHNFVRNLTGKLTVPQFVNVISNLDLLVTIDSSPMHIAASAETPFIVLLGKSTSPFCTVKPKVDFGVYLKNENSLLDESLFISQITPLEIIEQIEAFFCNKSNCITNVLTSV